MAAGVSVEFFESMSAIVPVTCGAAALVPQLRVYGLQLFAALVSRLDAVVIMSTPGAAISGFGWFTRVGPRLDVSAITSFFGFSSIPNEATEIAAVVVAGTITVASSFVAGERNRGTCSLV
jgi:hypothetical protein